MSPMYLHSTEKHQWDLFPDRYGRYHDWTSIRWMHGINNQRADGTTYMRVSKLYHHSNTDVWWVCQGMKIFVYPSCYLDQYHSKTYWFYNNFTLIWMLYIYPNGIEEQMSSATHTLLISIKVSCSIYIPGCTKINTTSLSLVDILQIPWRYPVHMHPPRYLQRVSTRGLVPEKALQSLCNVCILLNGTARLPGMLNSGW